ncbi:MAG: hypothetical protein HYT80_07520 [Euryarchaeota archaeon]|nr:hypothetical protein [Euryarchaeota archaeon]
MRFVPLVLLALLLAAVPAAQAGLVKKYDFSVELAALEFGGEEGNESGQAPDLALLTGRFHAQGVRQGLYGFVAAQNGYVGNTTKIEVINTQEDQASIFQRCAPSFGQDPSCLAERIFLSANLTLGSQANFLLYNGEAAFNYTAASGFALLTLFKPPQDLGGGAVANLTLENSLLAVGQSIASTGRLDASSNATLGMMPDDNSTLTITDGVQSQEYNGKQYLFRIFGQPRFEVQSTGLLAPFLGNCTADLRPTSGSVLRNEFQPESINTVLSSFGSQQSVVNEDVATGIKEIAPILNGVFFGTAAASIVNDEPIDNVEFGLIRYGEVTLTPTSSGATAKGRSDFLLMGANGFYTTSKGVNFGFLAMPNLSMILWVVAAGAIIAGFVLKPALAGPQLGGFGLIRLIALVFHGVAFLLSFLLWDNEVHDFLGTSLVTLFAEGGLSQGTTVAVTGLFEIVPYTLGLFMFGMPIRFLVNSGLKMGGLQKARGIGKGIGNIAVWGLGTPFIPFFLNGLVQPLVDQLGNVLPK